MSDKADLIKDVVYKEYERLQGGIDAVVNGSFTDFATLSVFGAMLAWKPITDRLTSTKDTSTSPFILCLGFSTMFVVLAIIATRDLMKQAIVFYAIGELKVYEDALRSSLAPDGQELFRSSSNFGAWFRESFIPISTHFRLLVVGLSLSFPLVILWPRSRRAAAGFIGVAAVCLAVYISALSQFFALTHKVIGP
ncbi:hypothetical protein [Ideonella sp. YS5]|uniref:hypothetical protein n=1 Tax=Ideonella sp. YS5 TaxID=3453714 RepID=UPI003EF013ED